jgi:anti-sigma regulatory factor (Ser/Thr protein kinase)
VTSTDGVLRARIDLPTTAGSVPVARRLVAQLLVAWSAETRHEESMLLISELVTNVVRHVRPATTVTIELILSALKLRVAVVDGSPAPPLLRERGPAGGHGMWLVSALPTDGAATSRPAANRCGSSSTSDQ